MRDGDTVPLTLDGDTQIGTCRVDGDKTILFMDINLGALPDEEDFWDSGRAYKVLERSVDYGFYGAQEVL